MSTLKIKRENGKIFCPLADSWHIETPEEKVRQEYIKILVENYGYSLDQMAQEIKVNNSQRGQGKARADIVIWKSKQDKIESKAAFIVVRYNLRKDAQNLTNDEVKNKLKTITQGQKSDKILGLMAMTFRAFCDLADWDSVGTEETNKIETPHVVLKSDNTEKSQTKTDPTTTDMNLHYNIQIHLPETTNMAVYDAIFQSLKKHLM